MEGGVVGTSSATTSGAQMNKDKYIRYGITAVAAVGIAVWAGVPAYFVLLLACPVMMFFMMGSTSGGKGRSDAESHRDGPDARTGTPTDGAPHDRIDNT